jgi:hypothetical protein
MDRRFLMPAASALALCVTNTACTSVQKQFIDDWIGTTLDDGEDFYNLPYTYTDTYAGVTYTTTSNVLLQVLDDGRAAFGSYYEYSSSDGQQEREEYLYSGDWEKAGGREFLLTFEEDLFSGDEIDMNCTLEKGNEDLTCRWEAEFITDVTYQNGSYIYETETREVILEMVRRTTEE